ncbi:MAG TPA: inorganic phosphate transporter [Mycobacteriales bacterium]
MPTAALLVLAVAFAYSMGAHYTGACMGMPHALGAVTARRALLIMAPLSLIGAAVASHRVARTVGFTLVDRPLRVPAEIVVLAVAFALTSAFNRLRIPTSTIQILVFTVGGVALGVGTGVHWATVGGLVVLWVLAPAVAGGLGFGLTRVLDQARSRIRDARTLPMALVAVGAVASFSMGANDVANATGALVGTRTVTPLEAGLLGGAGLAAGVLTWGRPLLEKVAFDIVTVDASMATAGQLVQAVVVLLAVAFGLFTSMNQALVGAMAGAGLARGRHTVHAATLAAIGRGWLIGPAAGIGLGYVVTRLVGLVAGGSALGG